MILNIGKVQKALQGSILRLAGCACYAVRAGGMLLSSAALSGLSRRAAAGCGTACGACISAGRLYAWEARLGTVSHTPGGRAVPVLPCSLRGGSLGGGAALRNSRWLF